MTSTSHGSLEELAAKRAYEAYTEGIHTAKWEDVSESMRDLWYRAAEEVIDVVNDLGGPEQYPRRTISNIDWSDPDPLIPAPKPKMTLRGEDVIEPSNRTLTVITDGIDRPKGVILGNVDISEFVTEMSIHADRTSAVRGELTIVPDRIETIDATAWGATNPWAGQVVPTRVTKGPQ